MRFFVFMGLVIVMLILIGLEPGFAQCPMCKASVESAMKEGNNYGLWLNKGILYLLTMPYLLFSTIFLLWYKNYRRNKVVIG